MTKNRFGNGRKMPQAQAHHIAEPPAVSFLSYSDALEIMGSACRLVHSVSIPELGSIFHGSPHTPIGDVQEGIAETYGVRFAWVSTNGTTSLNVLSLKAITSPGDKVLEDGSNNHHAVDAQDSGSIESRLRGAIQWQRR